MKSRVAIRRRAIRRANPTDPPSPAASTDARGGGALLWPRRRWAAHWLRELPAGVALVAVGSAALDASSYLANTFDAPRHGGPLLAGALCLTLLAALTCFLAATRRGHGPLPPKLAVLLILPLALWVVWTAGQSLRVMVQSWPRALAAQGAARYGSDDMFYNHYNAVLVLHGQNPYVGEHLTGAITYFHVNAYTPIARGHFADLLHDPTAAERDAVAATFLAHPSPPPPEIDPRTTHSYPAGAFLLALPAIWAGLSSIALPQLAALLALWTLVVLAAPRPWRLAVAVLPLLAVDGIRQVAGGDFEIWPLLFLAGAWLAAGRGWLSGMSLGIACAIKQTAWLAVPFYLVWVWRERGPAEAARRAGWALGAFLALNAPWIIASPREWLASLFLPVSLPLLPDGSGLVGLALAGALPLGPRWLYAALELAVLLTALVWYWRHHARFPFAGVVLPLLPLIFAWRSSERYFELLPVVAALALALTLSARRRAETAKSAPAPAAV